MHGRMQLRHQSNDFGLLLAVIHREIIVEALRIMLAIGIARGAWTFRVPALKDFPFWANTMWTLR